MGFVAHDLGVDLGTSNTLVYVRHKGIVINEPTIVVVDSTNERKVRAVGDDAKIIIASTASPYKFAPAVCSALGIDYDGDEFAAIDALSGRTGVPVPENLASLLGKAPRFTDVIERGDMKERVLAF